ncbi:dihydrofolate reductase family protein [Streptomyces xinghaiensis]
MRSVTYSMGVSLDGYIAGPGGHFDWTEPDEEVFRFWIDDIREVGVHLLGRRLYETMLYWETAEAAALGLIDEYRIMVHPVLVGGGTPFFPRDERRVDLELAETRTFGSKVVYPATAWRVSRLLRRASPTSPVRVGKARRRKGGEA